MCWPFLMGNVLCPSCPAPRGRVVSAIAVRMSRGTGGYSRSTGWFRYLAAIDLASGDLTFAHHISQVFQSLDLIIRWWLLTAYFQHLLS